MPRYSFRRLMLDSLSNLKAEMAANRELEESLYLLDNDSLFVDNQQEKHLVLENVELAVDFALSDLEHRRYLHRPTKYRTMERSGINVFERDLETEDSSLDGNKRPWLTDEEFLQKYRVRRGSFNEIVNLIKDHPVFREGRETSNKSNKRQVPPAHQLMVLLHYLGSEGSGASNPRLRNVFGIGRGTAHLYRERCCKAISSLRDVAVYWPDIEERKAIARRTNSQFGSWPNCIGIADGTLFPLSSAPRSEDAPDYSGRKYGYSISCMVVCDDKRYIRHFLAGFPGSAHDSRVFNATHLAQNADDYFGDKYYLIGDSAFANTKFFVAAYKKPRGRVLTTEQEAFNTHLSKLRINSEHTIGILKARFPFLKKMALMVSDDPKSVRTVVRYIECAIILHNLLLVTDGVNADEWLQHKDYDKDDASTVAHDNTEFDDTLMMPIAPGGPNDERRSRLHNYFRDYIF